MAETKPDIFQELFSSACSALYKNLFPLYRALYFTYKSCTERRKISFLRQNVRKGMVAVDIGANIGFYSLILSDLVGETGRVYAFEPEAENFAHLKDAARNRKNIIPYAAAAGDRTGEIYLYLSNSMNVDHQTYDSGEKRRRIKVRCVSMDGLFKSRKIDVAKIDVQGYEYYVLRGMQKAIRRSKGMIIIGELWPYGLEKAGASAEKVLGFFRRFDFGLEFEDDDFIRRKGDKGFYTEFYALRKKADAAKEKAHLHQDISAGRRANSLR